MTGRSHELIKETAVRVRLHNDKEKFYTDPDTQDCKKQKFFKNLNQHLL